MDVVHKEPYLRVFHLKGKNCFAGAAGPAGLVPAQIL
jgi:hypothetical protein